MTKQIIIAEKIFNLIFFNMIAYFRSKNKFFIYYSIFSSLRCKEM